MKARVLVSMKATVLDPQGKAVCSALHGQGHKAISDVRQGKFFDIAIADGVTREEARKEIEVIAHEVLANPVIEEYTIEILDR
jgi:phosphoribosylformylglycinamidine synthase subunit PurS